MIFIRRLIRFSKPERRAWDARKAEKSALFRCAPLRQKDHLPWKENLLFFLRICVLVFSAPFRLKKVSGVRFLYYEYLDDPDTLHLREYFIRKYEPGLHAKEKLWHFTSKSSLTPLMFQGSRLRALGRLLRPCAGLWFAAFCALWGRSRIRFLWKVQMGNYLLQQVLMHEPGVRQMLFFSYFSATYMSSFLASVFQPGYRPVIFASNAVLFPDNRYFYHPAATLILCSKFQKEEVPKYLERGWMQVREIQFWGPEDIILFDRIKDRECRYDIGIFSSGGWARTNGFWRAEDIGKVRSLAYADNPEYLILLDVIRRVAKLKSQHDLKVKLYLHPWELELVQKHGIEPPYLNLLRENGIDFDLSLKGSQEKIFESRIGVAVFSTILFDRYHFDLPGFYYHGKGIEGATVNPDYLGSYSRFQYRDMPELELKLEQGIRDRM